MKHSHANRVFDAVEVLNWTTPTGLLLVCEHASNHIPSCFLTADLSDALRESHAAWDPGAVEIARALACRLGACLVEAKVSRLVFDCNRPPGARDAMPDRSERFIIPINQDLTDDEIQLRIDTVYEPFRAAVAAAVGSSQALVTIHSFTPIYNGKERSVEIGVLHDADTAMADAMLSHATATIMGDLDIRRNEPYGPKDGVTHTLVEHGIKNNIPNVMIEIRNDLITSPEGRTRITEILEKLLTSTLSHLGVDGFQEKDASCASH